MLSHTRPRYAGLSSAFANAEKPSQANQPRQLSKRTNKAITHGKNHANPIVMLPKAMEQPTDQAEIHIDIDAENNSNNNNTNNTTTDTQQSPDARDDDPLLEYYDAKDCPTNFDEFSRHAIDPQNVAVNILPINTISLRLNRASQQQQQQQEGEQHTPINDTETLRLTISKLRAHMLSAPKSNNQQITSSIDHLSRITTTYPRRSPNYSLLTMQQHITSSHRSVAFSYMFQIHQDFHMQHGTFHLAISMLDRLMSTPFTKLYPDNLLLTAVTTLYLAYKLEDNRTIHAPNFEKLTGNRFTRADGQRTEATILSALNFDCAVPTLADFSTQFLYLFVSTQQCDIPELLKSPIQNINTKSGRFFRLLHCVEFITDIAVSDWSYANYSPIALGAAVLYTSLIMLSVDFPQSWNISLQLLTGLSSEDVLPAAKHLCQLARRVKKEKRIFEPLLRHYSSEYYYRIATSLDIPSDAQLEHSVTLNNSAIGEFLQILRVDPEALTFVAGLNVDGFRVLQVTSDRKPIYDDSELDDEESNATTTDGASGYDDDTAMMSESYVSLLNTSIHGHDHLHPDHDEADEVILNSDGTIDRVKAHAAHKARQLKQATRMLSPKLNQHYNKSGSPTKSFSAYHHQKEYYVTLIRDSSDSNFFIKDVHHRNGDSKNTSIGDDEVGQIIVKVWMKKDSVYEFLDGDVALTEYKSAKKLKKQKQKMDEQKKQLEQQQQRQQEEEEQAQNQHDHHLMTSSKSNSSLRLSTGLPPLPSPVFKTNSYSTAYSITNGISDSSSFSTDHNDFIAAQLGSPKPPQASDLANLFGSPKFTHQHHRQPHNYISAQTRGATHKDAPTASRPTSSKRVYSCNNIDSDSVIDVKRKKAGGCNIM